MKKSDNLGGGIFLTHTVVMCTYLLLYFTLKGLVIMYNHLRKTGLRFASKMEGSGHL